MELRNASVLCQQGQGIKGCPLYGLHVLSGFSKTAGECSRWGTLTGFRKTALQPQPGGGGVVRPLYLQTSARTWDTVTTIHPACLARQLVLYPSSPTCSSMLGGECNNQVHQCLCLQEGFFFSYLFIFGCAGSWLLCKLFSS